MLKVVFLDFTGTIDALPLSKEELDNIKSVKTIKPKIIQPTYKTKSLKPWKKPLAGDAFYENVEHDAAYFGGFGAEEGEVYTVEEYDYGPDKRCVKFLQKLLDATGAKIVYSSTRRHSGWEKCAEYVGLPLRYSLGGKHAVTPDMPFEFKPFKGLKGFKEVYSALNDGELPPVLGNEEVYQGPVVVEGGSGRVGYKQRQEEIQEWFKEWKGEKVVNYVILDDDPINDPEMAKHWIPSIYDNGFLEAEFKQALKILS